MGIFLKCSKLSEYYLRSDRDSVLPESMSSRDEPSTHSVNSVYYCAKAYAAHHTPNTQPTLLECLQAGHHVCRAAAAAPPPSPQQGLLAAAGQWALWLLAALGVSGGSSGSRACGW